MGKQKAATKAERRRMDIITREIGCIPCRLWHGRFVQAECNHLLNGNGGYRLGHGDTVPECTWHHRGECLIGIDARAMRRTFGPSRKLHKRKFRESFGSDQLLLQITNEYVRQFEAQTIGGGVT